MQIELLAVKKEYIDMTDILFEYDHILIRSEYRTPDIHKHLAAHMVFGIKDELTCVVGEDTFY